MRKAVLLASAVLASGALSGCGAGSAVRETLAGPKEQVRWPSRRRWRRRSSRSTSSQPETHAPASANSLWRTGARTFFNDQRAAKVGDILTVLITINDSAKTAERHQPQPHQLANAAGVPHFFGLESSLGKILPGLRPRQHDQHQRRHRLATARA